MIDYQVSLSFPEERREVVAAVADRLAVALGREQVFFYPFHLAELARPDLNLFLQRVYHDRSRLIVAFLDRHYPVKEWCGVERRVIFDLIKRGCGDQVMLVKLEDVEDPDFLSIDGYIDARSLSAADLAALILERLAKMEKPAAAPTPLAARVTRPGLLRGLLDRLCPRLHRALTRLGTLSEPPELAPLEAYLSDLAGRIRQDILNKTYLPLHARSVSPGALGEDTARDPFVRLVHLTIRQVLGREEGGDSATAQIAAVNRRSRRVRNIVRAVLGSPDPLVLLGDPGSGKTMTLQEAALALVLAESRRVFPKVLLYVRLGEFHVDGKVGPDEVLAYVKKSSPAAIRPWIDDLDRSRRLVILFDGMDEMSRDHYTEHTEALSVFAEARRGRTRTLFSCRITDFSPAFIHRRLVLLPFDRGQITRFLQSYLEEPSLEIDGRTWRLPQLARRLAAGDLPVDSQNPFVLWLLCLFLQERRTWPRSRVELLAFFLEENYRRKQRDAATEGFELPPAAETLRAWARFAWVIMERNLGAAVPVEVLLAGASPEEAADVLSAIQAGKWCGVLNESLQEAEHQVRFEHHRFQEYFTALWIHEERPAVSWLEKLDAPRWQETMLNLVFLGGAKDGVQALAHSVGPKIRYAIDWFAERKREAEQAPEGTSFPQTFAEAGVKQEWEASLADRIELGARLVQGAPGSPAVREELRPCVQEGLELLVEKGRPVTQVKMMRACRHLTDVDLLSVLERPLRSPVNWVRDQALILLGAIRSGSGTGTSDLASEMELQFALGEFLPLWPTFARAVAGAAVPRLWVCFVVTTLFTLADLSLLALATVGLIKVLFSALRVLPTWPPVVALMNTPSYIQPWVRSFQSYLPPRIQSLTHSPLLTRNTLLSILALIPPSTFAMIQAAFTISTAALAFRFRPQKAWVWCLNSVPAGMGLLVTGASLWQGNFEWFMILSILVVILCLAMSLVCTAGGVGVHLTLLALYGWVSRFTSDTRSAPLLLPSISWREGGSREYFRSVAPAASGALFMIIIMTFYFPGLFYGLSVLTCLLLLATVVLGYWKTRRHPIRTGHQPPRPYRKWTRAKFLGAGKTTGQIVILIGVFWVSLIYYPIIHAFNKSAMKVVLFLLFWGFILNVVVFFGNEIYWRLRIALAPQRIFLPGTFTPDSWTVAFQKADPRQQKDLLLRTTHQSLGIDPGSFLKLLVEVEPHVKQEPALSTYWDRRDQLEQALRQERQG